MRTTDDIIRDLRERQANGEDVRQQISSHEALARLRAELASFDHREFPDRANGLRNQIGVHGRLVEEDVDERIAVRPDKDSVDEVPELDKAKRPKTS